MDIAKVDKNFMQNDMVCDKIVYHDATQPPFELYGISYNSSIMQYERIPDSIAETISEGVYITNSCTAGGRLKFSTNSKNFSINVEINGLCKMSHMPLSGSAGFCLCEDCRDTVKYIASFMPAFSDDSGYKASVTLDDTKTHNYILYFPLYNGVKKLEIGLDANACLFSGKMYRDVLPILYYGSSITQGGCASRPDNSYQAIISKWNDIDYINLGYSGNAKAENEMVDFLSSLPASVFVCDYDHNATDAKFLYETHYNLYEKYRAKNLITPIIFISKPDFYRDKQALERLEIIEATYKKAKQNNDNNVYFIDGRELFGDEDRDNCTVDGTHPNDLGFYRMAKTIYAKLKQIDDKNTLEYSKKK